MARIKIAQVLEATGGGSGRHLIDVVTALAQDNRFEVHLISSSRRIDERYRIGLESVRDRIFVHEVPMVRAIKPGLDWKCMWMIHNYLRKHGPFQVVHLHSSKAGAVGAVAARLARVPNIIFTPHAFYSMGLTGKKRQIYESVEKVCGLLCHNLVAVSSEESDYILQHKLVDKFKLWTVPNAIEPPDLISTTANGQRLRQELGIQPGTRLIGSIGRLTGQKNPLLFVETVARRAQRYSAEEESYLMAGTGDLEPEVLAAIKHHQLGDRLRFLGFRSDVDHVLAALDVYVLHSMYEGMPYIILEAMGNALPIVSTNVAGVQDPLCDGGVLVEINNVDALDVGIDQMICPQQRQKMGAANRARLEHHYSIDSMMDSLKNIYLSR
jgi:glycosyltransferase involved in cell wall biosynthesis